MRAASSTSRNYAGPSFDLHYSVHDELDSHPDSQFVMERTLQAMIQEGTSEGGRALDVASGAGHVAAGLWERGAEAWGLDPSQEMLGLTRWLFPAQGVVLVRGIAEQLPFRDASFDCLTCKEALDHFVDPSGFVREAARVVKPGGRVIIILSNYESLSFRLGRVRHKLARLILRRPPPAFRPHWQPPPDHCHKGDLTFVRGLGGNWLRLERCYGISLMWLTYGWGIWLGRLPRAVTDRLLVALDRIAYRAPGLADMIVSVWRPTESALSASNNSRTGSASPAGVLAAGLPRHAESA